ncbi:MAG: hypothetical protein PHP98_07530 [Kiritimatiellae bacterium]|nr:hypothetical protein [Kiritimatiellia bacterium]
MSKTGQNVMMIGIMTLILAATCRSNSQNPGRQPGEAHGWLKKNAGGQDNDIARKS